MSGAGVRVSLIAVEAAREVVSNSELALAPITNGIFKPHSTVALQAHNVWSGGL